MFKRKQAPVTGVVTGEVPGARTPPAAPAASSPAAPPRPPSPGKQAYESRRAAKAGMGLEKWMAEKERRVQAERQAVERAHRKAVARKPGLLRRLLDRAHRPI